MFYELCAYISLGVHWKVYFRHVLHIPRRDGIPSLSGIRIGIRISWRSGMTADSHGTRVPDRVVCRSQASLAVSVPETWPSVRPSPEIWPSASARLRRGTGAGGGSFPGCGPSPSAWTAKRSRQVATPSQCLSSHYRHNATDRQKRTPRTFSRGPYRPIRAGTAVPAAGPARTRRSPRLPAAPPPGTRPANHPRTRRPAIPARSSPRAGARIHDEGQPGPVQVTILTHGRCRSLGRPAGQGKFSR
jgi:hypothetical protein